ncbi:hypothetical protein ACFP3U_23720 [Kitasatospora misakiensis]|uniref:Condensation domain-containing protein n=1 Tax=Kitasatospora misakiensis TaxID=67330 RepID=A0ABW0X8C5_9ACTN
MTATLAHRIPLLAGQRTHLSTPPQWGEVAVDTDDLTLGQARDALAAVVGRHEALRTVCAPAAGDFQFVLDAPEVEFRAEAPASWPEERPRWFALHDAPARRLVLRVCPSLSDRPGLEILARDLAAAVAATRTGRPPAWRPAPSLAAVATREDDPRTRARLRANAQYFRGLLDQPFTGRPVVPRAGAHHRWARAGGAVDAATARAFLAHATAIGVSWPNLLRAAFFRAEEAVWAHGEIVAAEAHPQRDDEERRRLVGPLSVTVPLVLDLTSARDLAADDWARALDRTYREALGHLPVDPAALGPDPIGRQRPHYRLDIRDHSPLPPAPAPAAPPTSPTTVLHIDRDPQGLRFTVAEHTARCGEHSLDLLATCLTGAIESYAGLTGTPSTTVLEAAVRLRASVGPWACLEDRDATLVAYTASTPTAPLTDTPEGHP